jgi:hypothetical protein
MAKSKTIKGISNYYNSNNLGVGETAVREAFLRASRDTLDNFGISEYSVERVQGMVEMLEHYALIIKEQE